MTMDKYELQKLRDLPIEGVAERLGLRVTRHKSLCPFHDDHHASLSFNVRKNTFRCFVCDASGGTIDLVMRHLGIDFKAACKWLADGTNVIIEEYKPTSPSGDKRGAFDASRYEGFFMRPWLSDEARKFLFDERMLDPRVISWCRVSSWRDRSGVNWLQTPYYDVDGKLIGVQNRNLDYKKICLEDNTTKRSVTGGNALGYETKETLCLEGSTSLPRFRFPYGSRCSIYNLQIVKRLKPGDELWIAEGCSDCWALLSSGKKAIAIPSATLLSPKDKELLSSLSSSLSSSSSLKWNMFPDKDAPGERLFLQLKEILPDLVHHHLPIGCKDFSDYYVQQKTHIADGQQ